MTERNETPTEQMTQSEWDARITAQVCVWTGLPLREIAGLFLDNEDRLATRRAENERLRADVEMYEQTSGELCEVCGWRGVRGSDGCAFCAHARLAADLHNARSTVAALTDQLREAREREAQWNADKDELRRYIDDLDREHAATRAELRDAASDARIERDAALAELATLRTPSPDVEGWISVKDRLPEPCEEGTQIGITASYIVLAASVDGVVGTAWVDYLDDPPVWRGCDGCEEDEITHWRALPDPPKGDA